LFSIYFLNFYCCKQHRGDIETLPDLRGFAAANGLIGKTDAEVLEAIGDKFPKNIYHSIVCIGALVAHHQTAAIRRPRRQ
jgi:3'-5' exonuclease